MNSVQRFFFRHVTVEGFTRLPFANSRSNWTDCQPLRLTGSWAVALRPSLIPFQSVVMLACASKPKFSFCVTLKPADSRGFLRKIYFCCVHVRLLRRDFVCDSTRACSSRPCRIGRRRLRSCCATGKAQKRTLANLSNSDHLLPKRMPDINGLDIGGEIGRAVRGRIGRFRERAALPPAIAE
jgi:hypothetical protein